MRIAAIIQARMGSTRLPGKSLLPLAGQPLLGHIIDRVRSSRRVNAVVVATTVEPADEELARYAQAKGVAAFRGDALDVLDRYYQAARVAGADIIVRITADDPFKDPDVIDLLVERLLGSDNLDYVSNTIEPTYPEGLDVETFRFAALARAWQEAKLPSEREHVTPYIWKHPDLFKILNVRHMVDLSGLRWTLDYPEDLRFAEAIYARLYHGDVFKMEAILKLLADEPELAKINSGPVRNAGYLKSLQSENIPESQ